MGVLSSAGLALGFIVGFIVLWPLGDAVSQLAVSHFVE
jgi:multisubunit Na+/H+ antiporter MnhE subunit